MTREEAVEVLKQDIPCEYDADLIEALDMAINALRTEPYFWEKCPYYEPDIMFDGKEEYDWGKCTYKTEPCEDCISRSELLNAIDTWDKFGFEHTGCFVREPKDDFVTYVHYDDVVKCIKGMPSVQPEPFINKPCVSEQSCREDKIKVLMKIKAELADMEKEFESRHDYPRADTLKYALSIIDKHMKESEDKE